MPRISFRILLLSLSLVCAQTGLAGDPLHSQDLCAAFLAPGSLSALLKRQEPTEQFAATLLDTLAIPSDTHLGLAFSEEIKAVKRNRGQFTVREISLPPELRSANSTGTAKISRQGNTLRLETAVKAPHLVDQAIFGTYAYQSSFRIFLPTARPSAADLTAFEARRKLLHDSFHEVLRTYLTPKPYLRSLAEIMRAKMISFQEGQRRSSNPGFTLRRSENVDQFIMQVQRSGFLVEVDMDFERFDRTEKNVLKQIRVILTELKPATPDYPNFIDIEIRFLDSEHHDVVTWLQREAALDQALSAHPR